MSFHSRAWHEHSYTRWWYTGFIFNRLPYLFSMVDSTIVENQNTTWPWVGVSQWDLDFTSWVYIQRGKQIHTTNSCKNSWNFSLVTEPSMMSCAMMPSRVIIGRIENLLPCTKHFRWTHLLPWCDQPVCLFDVLSSLCTSSPNISMSGLGTSSMIQFMNITQSHSLHSNSLLETSLCVKWSHWRVRYKVVIDALTPWHGSNCSWISSK